MLDVTLSVDLCPAASHIGMRVLYKNSPLLGRWACCHHRRSGLVERASARTIESNLVAGKYVR